MDGAHRSATSIATETHAVVCSRCRRTVSVLVSELFPPSFRNPEDQAECPEIQERRGQDDGIPDLAVCDALARSLGARLESSEVTAVVHDDIWYVVRRTPGRPSPLYSPGQARAQAEVWYSRGQTNLGDQFRQAADDAERRRSGDHGDVPDKPRGTITIYVMVIAALGFAAWYFVLRQPTPVQTLAPAVVEPRTIARAPEAAPPVAAPATTPPPAAAPAATPQVAETPPEQPARETPSAPPKRPPDSTSNTPQPPLQPGSNTNQTPPSPGVVAAPPPPVVAASPPVTMPPPAAVVAPPPSREAVVAPVQAPPPQSSLEPEMVALPGGTFAMGSNDDISEKPIHKVTVKPFAISKLPITVREWNACVAAKGCALARTGNDDAPVANLSWNDAQRFVVWLAEATHKPFRLPSEAEWEYAARGGTTTTYWWGDRFQLGMANCKGCGEPYDSTQPASISGAKPNPFGLYHMGGGVAQWVADCWHRNYRGAPVDGSPWVDDADCASRVIRSGSWKNDPSYVRSSSRDHYDTNARYLTLGFRVARSP